jgi:hypothetical protein
VHHYFDHKPPPDPFADFWREYQEYRHFREWARQTFPELAKQLAEELESPNATPEEPISGRCPCCNPANRPVGVWLSEDCRIVPARQSTDYTD